VRLIDLGESDWAMTQAAYHALADLMAADAPDTVILTRPRTPYLCLGYHQPLEGVFDLRACERMGLPIIRRRVGGGATYLDRNQLFYQFIFHHRRAPATPRRIYRHFLAAPVAALRALVRLARMSSRPLAGMTKLSKVW
jgi:lipoate-protein ligase A